MKFLIAGQSGIIGSILSASISKIGEVYTIGRKKSISGNHCTINFNNQSEIEDYFFAAPKFDALVYFIGLAHNKGNKKDFDEHIFVNQIILERIVTAMKKHQRNNNFKIIFSSTISVYGELYGVKKYDEDHLLSPCSPYAISKKSAENFLLKYHKSNSWILRYAPVYSKKFMLNIDRRTKVNNFFFKVGSGESRLSLCNVGNIEISILSILNEKIPSGVYNISDNKIYNYNDLLNIKKAKNVIRVPRLFVLIIYLISKILKINSLKENSIKLLTDNIYPPNKLNKFIPTDKDLSCLST
jgi:nucleoside-diphosphate-sugar epimerase